MFLYFIIPWQHSQKNKFQIWFSQYKNLQLKIINNTKNLNEKKLSFTHSISIYIDYEILESQLEKR